MLSETKYRIVLLLRSYMFRGELCALTVNGLTKGAYLVDHFMQHYLLTFLWSIRYKFKKSVLAPKLGPICCAILLAN